MKSKQSTQGNVLIMMNSKLVFAAQKINLNNTENARGNIAN